MTKTNEILERRRFVCMAQNAPYWAMVNFASFLICFIEFKFSFFPSLSSLVIVKHVISFFEIILMCLFFINSIYNLYIIIIFKKFTPPIELSEQEYILYGIDKNEIGFKLKENNSAKENSEQKNKTHFTSTPPFDISANLSYSPHSSLDSTAMSSKLFNDSNVNDTKFTPWFYNDPKLDGSFSKISDTSLNQSLENSLLRSGDLRFRKSRSFLHKNYNDDSDGSVITSKSSLQRYLLEREERDEEIQELIQAERRFGITSSPPNVTNSPNTSATMSSNPFLPNHFLGSSSQITLNHDLSFGHQNQSPNPFNTPNRSLFNSSLNQTPPGLFSNSPQTMASPLPPPLPYKPAIKINRSDAQNSSEKSESLNSSHRILEKVLAKLDVDDSRLNQMVENIRKWISQTILKRLVAEIESINKKIVEKGYIDSLIGETSIKQLKELAESKRDEFPTLEQVCPFLDVSNVRQIENNIPFQQYLVRRIKDLAKGGCMIEFLWDGGGSYNYKPWTEAMITDTELIMHMFCVYMDSRLLSNPSVPEGRPFTSQYFRPLSSQQDDQQVAKSTSSSSTSTFRSDTYIKQDKAYPPHYSLVLKGEPFEIPPGRNNLFHTLLVFIHHIKVKNFGLLGRINLGPSGLNIAWVIEK